MHRHPALIPMLLIAAGCSGPPANGAPPAPEAAESVAMTLVSVEPGRFPKSFWTFDVRLANRSPEVRWFLIPDPPEKGLELEREADGIEVVSLGSAGEIRMLRIAATHNLLALRLAPGSEVTLDNLELTSWDERPLESVEIWAVRELRLDGDPLGAGRLGLPEVLFRGNAAVDAGTREEAHSWFDPQLRGHALAYEPDERWVIPVGEGKKPGA